MRRSFATTIWLQPSTWWVDWVPMSFYSRHVYGQQKFYFFAETQKTNQVIFAFLGISNLNFCPYWGIIPWIRLYYMLLGSGHVYSLEYRWWPDHLHSSVSRDCQLALTIYSPSFFYFLFFYIYPFDNEVFYVFFFGQRVLRFRSSK